MNLYGYKQTEIGVIPEDWRCAKMEEIATISMCKRIFADQTTEKGEIPFYKIGTFGKEADAYISRALYNEYRNRFSFPKKGDVLISAAGTLGRTVVYDGKDAYFQDSNIVWLDIDKNALCNEYLNHYYRVIKWASSEGSTIARLYNGIIYATNIALPPLKEQEHIAEALSDVDGMISSLEKLIAKKKAVKQGAMQELLTGKRRLHGFSEEWIKVQLKDIFDFYKGNGLSKEKVSDNGKNACILYGELFTRYTEVIGNITNKTNSDEGLRSCQFDVLMPGSTTTTGLDLATASVIMDNDVLLGGDIVVLHPKKEMDTRIFGYLLRIMAKEILQHTQGITIVHLNTKTLHEMEVLIPKTVEEQTAIADILADVDNEIEALEQKLTKTRQLKQGMMQQLLTGKIRLV